MRTPVFLITAATLLPSAVWAQVAVVPATPARAAASAVRPRLATVAPAPTPAAPVVPAKPAAVAPALVQVVPAKPLGLTPTPAAVPAKPQTLTPAPAAQSNYNRRLFTKDLLTGRPEPRVDVDLENATVREALKQVFGEAHQEYQVEEDVPDEPRVTLRARGLRLSTALQLVLPEEGVRTTLFVKDGKGTLRVYKVGGINAPLPKPGLNVLGGISSFRFPLNADGTVTLPEKLPDELKNFLQAHPDLNLNAAVPYIMNLQEQRSTFRCPNCKGQSTVIRKADQPKCEKCNRVFMPDWQYCPADGTKRPAAASEWRFCPFCGKRVELEKSSEVPLLGELPIIGRLFRKAPAGDVLQPQPVAPTPAAPRVEPQRLPLDPPSVPTPPLTSEF
jgi:hypothetical protein